MSLLNDGSKVKHVLGKRENLISDIGADVSILRIAAGIYI